MKVLQTILVPQESVNDQSLRVIALNFKTGDVVHKDDVLIELETSKAILTLEADIDGYVIYYCNIDDELPLNALAIQIVDTKPETGTGEIAGQPPQNTEISSSEVSQIEYDTQFSKKALFILEENNLSKTLFKNYDFVNEEIILEYLNPADKTKTDQPSPIKDVGYEFKKQNEVRSDEFFSKVALEKLPPGKRREIEYLSSIQNGGLVSTLYIDINTLGIIETVSAQLSYFKSSILPLVVFETSRLLVKYPLLNAFYYNGQICKYLNVNVGLAIDIDDGLKVVKLPNTDTTGILEIEEKIFQLSNKYLDKKLEITDFADVTFTITDLSAVGTSFFAPLINKDNSAILGISKIDNKLNQCILSISFDHRVTSGKYAGSFLAELKSRVESFANTNRAVIKPGLECYKCLKNISEDTNDIGFIKVVTKSGEEKLICDSCLLMF